MCYYAIFVLCVYFVRAIDVIVKTELIRYLIDRFILLDVDTEIETKNFGMGNPINFDTVRPSMTSKTFR